MSITIENAFTRQYEEEVKSAYQREGSLLRGTIRTKNGVVGKSTTFPIIGKGESGSKTRHGNVPVMNAEWGSVECPIVDQYAGEYSDDLDELKTNVDVRLQNARAAAMALGRWTDMQIIAAMSTAGTTIAMTVSSKEATENSILGIFEALFDKDVPPGAGVFASVSWRTWSQLMKVEGFTNSEYRGPDLLPFVQGGRALQATTWMGAHWITHSGLPKVGNVRTNFLYHYDAVGHAIQAELTTTTSWENTKSSYFLNSRQAMGAVLIDDDGVVKFTLDESSALPVS